MALVVDGRVGLGDDIGFLAVGGEIVDVLLDAAFVDLAVRGLQEPEIIDAGEGRQ